MEPVSYPNPYHHQLIRYSRWRRNGHHRADPLSTAYHLVAVAVDAPNGNHPPISSNTIVPFIVKESAGVVSNSTVIRAEGESVFRISGVGI